MTERLMKDQARALYIESKSLREVVKRLGVAQSSVSLWCRDLIEAQRVETERFRFIKEDIDRKKARDFYTDGKTINDIIPILGRSRQKIALWCRDLIKQNEKNKRIARDIRLRGQEKNEALAINGKSNGSQVLTKDQVVEIRRQVRQEQCLNLQYYAKKYQVSIATISVAIRGKTFQTVNHIEPPVTEQFPLPKRGGKRKAPSEALAREAIDLRRSDPQLWTYGKLAEWMGQKTGRQYRATHIARLLRNRDPGIEALEETKPVVKSTPTPRKALTPEQKAKRLVAMRESREKLKRFIEEHNEYEQSQHSG